MPDLQTSIAAFERSIVRSRLRGRALMMLSSLSEAFPRQLARAVGVDPSRLVALLEGNDEDYAISLSLVGLGLATIKETPHGRVYAITATGRRKARQIAARDVRRERGRMANRGELVPRVHPHPWPGAPTGAGAPVDGPGDGAPPPDTQCYRWSTVG